jgi:hypothetical protein
MVHTPEPLDSALAHFAWFVSEMPTQRILHLRPVMGLEALKILRGFGGENNLVFHSGHNIARLSFHVKPDSA